MDFSTTTLEHARLEELTRAARGLPAASRDADPREGWQILGSLGLLGGTLPPESGGGGWSALETSRAFEAAARGSVNVGLIFGAAAHLLACVVPVHRHGSERAKELYLPEMASGRLIGANAITEDHAGSDVAAIDMTATATRGGYVLNGTKSYVSNAPIADVFVTYAVTDPTGGTLGRSAFVVTRSSPGVHVGEPFQKLGLEGCWAARVTFEDCFVPDDRLLGRPGMGGAIFQESMLWERTCLFGLYVGLQQRVLDETVDHVRKRRQFGRRLSSFQAVRHQIADMKVRLEAARLLLYRASWGIDSGEDAALFSALSKVAISESAVASSVTAVQLLGGAGYISGSHAEMALRDSIGSTIFSGTSNIQRELVAAELGL